MKVETPQILWNAEGDKGMNAALLSISMLQSGMDTSTLLSSTMPSSSSSSSTSHVLATAGTTELIHLWRITFSNNTTNTNTTNTTNTITNTTNTTTTTTTNQPPPPNHHDESSARLFHPPSPKFHTAKTEHLCRLSRHDGPVNAVAFSPDGLHLATAGETGAVIIFSVPVQWRGNRNGRHGWSQLTREHDLTTKVVTVGDAILDVSWSADSKRLLLGCIDHSVIVLEDVNYNVNHSTTISSSSTTSSSSSTTTTTTQPQVDSLWKVVYRNAMDHSHFVQGVAYDPLGVYLTSMSSDRSVRIFPRKPPPRPKTKKVLRPVAHNAATITTTTTTTTNHASASDSGGSSSSSNVSRSTAPPTTTAVDALFLTDAKLELGKSKVLKYRRQPPSRPPSAAATLDAADTAAAPNKRHHHHQHYLYADEATLQSFVRRLAWTVDGAFLITPAALWQQAPTPPGTVSSQDAVPTNNTTKETPQYATCLFARHKWDEPSRVLIGLEKVSSNTVVCGGSNAEIRGEREGDTVLPLWTVLDGWMDGWMDGWLCHGTNRRCNKSATTNPFFGRDLWYTTCVTDA